MQQVVHRVGAGLLLTVGQERQERDLLLEWAVEVVQVGDSHR